MLSVVVALICLIYSPCLGNAVNSEDIINLSYLGERIYGKPNEESGLRLLESGNADGNPEEKGLYLEGDILFPIDGSQRNGLVSESYRWPNGQVPFQIQGIYNANEMDLIEKAISAYHQNTCIKFFPRRAMDMDYISIENDKSGCWSSIGRIGGKQVVNLQSPGCVTKIGTVMHELMHALGFLHEQNSEDRDKYITVNTNNIKPGYENNFDKAPTDSTYRFGVPYDYGSVMHYSVISFSKNNQPTITPKQTTNAEIGQRNAFSKRDIEKINRMYKCNSNGYQTPPNQAKPSGSITDFFNNFLGHEGDAEEVTNK